MLLHEPKALYDNNDFGKTMRALDMMSEKLSRLDDKITDLFNV